MSAETVTAPAAPTLTVATAKAPVGGAPARWMIPVLGLVAARATMSGIGPDAAETRTVSSPVTLGAGSEAAHWKFRRMSVGPNDWVGAMATTNAWAAPLAIEAGAFGGPTG